MRSTKEMPVVKVGQDLAFRLNNRYAIHVVTHITPTGRIKCGSYELNSDLSVRGKRDRGYWGPYRAEIVTDEIREQVHRSNMISKLSSFDFNSLSYDLLRRIFELTYAEREE